MKQKEELPNNGYAIIRCNDGVIVARLHSFPECDRALMYRRGDMVSFTPLRDVIYPNVGKSRVSGSLAIKLV